MDGHSGLLWAREIAESQCRTLIGSTIQIVPIEIITIRTDFIMATVHMDGESGLLAFFA